MHDMRIDLAISFFLQTWYLPEKFREQMAFWQTSSDMLSMEIHCRTEGISRDRYYPEAD
jgi:hypothetical protein